MKSVFVKAPTLKKAIEALKLAIASSVTLWVIGCTNRPQTDLEKSLELSVIEPSWAICLGERAKDYDKGTKYCTMAKQKTLAKANKPN